MISDRQGRVIAAAPHSLPAPPKAARVAPTARRNHLLLKASRGDALTTDDLCFLSGLGLRAVEAALVKARDREAAEGRVLNEAEIVAHVVDYLETGEPKPHEIEALQEFVVSIWPGPIGPLHQFLRAAWRRDGRIIEAFILGLRRVPAA